jgi:ubiquinol-cytochrome c reductase cytochrome c subunit
MRRATLTIAALALLAPGAAGSSTGPPAGGSSSATTGAALYAANCSSCHGPHGQGISAPRPGVGDIHGLGPSLTHAGALAADFYIRTGYMPLADPQEQPARSHVLFDERQIRSLVGYVASLGNGPPIPRPKPARGSISSGFELFTDHCAGCHQIAAEGGYVTGARVPLLGQATDVQIAEAVRTGPYVMPSFSATAISDGELNSIIRYVDYTKRPQDPGGWAIGRLGPVPEGMVAWLLAATVLVAACIGVSRRAGHD